MEAVNTTLAILNYVILGAEFAKRILLDWWWIIAPLILWRPFLFFWLWWRNEVFFSYINFVILEVILPRESTKPLRAMEQVVNSMWGNTHDPPDWWEKWVEGKLLLRTCFEIVSMEGKIHFFIRIPERSRKGVEASIHSQYPDAEITEVDDYTKYVPQDVPNKEWEIWGFDVELLKPEVYPIRTYEMFFEERPEMPEEKRLDPLSTLLEGLAKIGKNEHVWIQIGAVPVAPKEYPYVELGKKEVDKLMKRVEEKKGGSKSLIEMIKDNIMDLFFSVQPKEEEKKEGDTSSLFTEYIFGLTGEERKVVDAIEKKVSKYCFISFVRFLYLAKKDVYSPVAKTVAIGFFELLSTTNLNGMKPFPKTITKVHKSWFIPYNWFLPRLLYAKKRSMFSHYKMRVSPLFPESGGTFILNAEEIATMFHFPSRDISPVPFIKRVEAKKAQPPSEIPFD